MDEVGYQTEHAWRVAVLSELRAVRELLEKLAQPPMVMVPEGGDVEKEVLPTWILTDGQVAAVERAVLEEQRIRGKAYGG